MHLSQLEKFLKKFELLYYINTFAMEKSFMLQNIVSNIITKIKKQDFLVYFRKLSIKDNYDSKINFRSFNRRKSKYFWNRIQSWFKYR